MDYFCCTDTRRNAVKLHPVLNGIDYLEVLDDLSDPFNERQTTLFIHFLKPVAIGQLTLSNLVVEGGERIRNIRVVEMDWVSQDFIPLSPPELEEAAVLKIRVSKAGDFSTYTFRLVSGISDGLPPDGFDRILSSVDFSFKAACKSEFDCKPDHRCTEERVAPPLINYLTKDYAGFRQLMLDRISLLVPDWKERNPSDAGIAMVELLAYTADYLSYQQDAIATEAYLGTARRRISVRRHARLVDYFMHDGCNARTWLHAEVGNNVSGIWLTKESGGSTTKVLSKQEGLQLVVPQDSREYEKALNNDAMVFELMHDIELFAAHNEMHFYTWGKKACCLPKGATHTSLAGDFSTLKVGDVLIFCEVLGPETGIAGDADPAHRHPVRLTGVKVVNDPLFEPVDSPPSEVLFPVTEITWDAVDALPFPLCISANDGTENISVALGNNVMVDHGLTMEDEEESALQPSVVPAPQMQYAGNGTGCGCDSCGSAETETVAPRFFPKLKRAPLTHVATTDFTDPYLPAASLMAWEMRDTTPAITLTEIPPLAANTVRPAWKPKRDLLNSADNAKEFVVEMEVDGTAFIRFGDGNQGERPVPGTTFLATCRVGNGKKGNIGAESLVHLVTADPSVIAALPEGSKIWNPLPAKGGMEPETMEEVKQLAPNAFRKQKRAVTPADYEEFSKRSCPDIQHTATTFRWTGSWKTAFLTVDRLNRREVDAAFEADLRNKMERYRMAGFDLEVDAPVSVSLELEMKVCVNRNYFVSDVKAALLEMFSNRVLPDGRKGVFHPDNFSFGQTVYLSPLYAAAQAVQGVDSLKITRLLRQGDTNNDAVTEGKLIMGRREIARLDNDPNFPEHGVLNLIMIGGR
jgi:hypothetical protein